MSESHTHHHHVVGVREDRRSNERVTTFRCCHCGQEVERRQKIHGGGTVWSDSAEGCGPHRPRIEPYWRTG